MDRAGGEEEVLDASWIWLRKRSGANCYAGFELRFTADRVDPEARLLLSAETSFRLAVNGENVLWGPPREVPPYFYYERIALSGYLREGENVIAVTAHHQGVDSQAHASGTPALLVGGRVRTASGALDLADPAHWRGRRLPQYREGTHRLGICLGFSEHFSPGAVPPPFEPARLVARHPWAERPVALARDLPPMDPPAVRSPRSVRESAGGWLVDFGREVFGFVEMDFHAERPADFEIAYAEVLDAGRVDPRRHPAVDYRDRISAPPGTHSWRSYEKRAFRYLAINTAITPRRLAVIEQQQTPLRRRLPARRAADTDPAPRILDVSARTIELCADDMLMDCPWRERAQYLDIAFYMESLHALFGTWQPVRRFFHQYARGVGTDGALRMCYPSPAGARNIVDFTLGFPIMLARYAQLSGDWETARQGLPVGVRAVESVRDHEHGHLLVDPPGWIYLDNTNELSRGPRSAALNAIHAGAHRALARLLKLSGDARAAAQHEARHAAIRRAFRDAFLRGDRLLDSDAVPALEKPQYWSFHLPTGPGHPPPAGDGLVLHTRFRRPPDGGDTISFMAHGPYQAWIDGRPLSEGQDTVPWPDNALSRPHQATLPEARDAHTLTIAVAQTNPEWEFWLSLPGHATFDQTTVQIETRFPITRCPPRRADAKHTALRPWAWPRLSQSTIGYAAYHGMLDDDEARHLLLAALPEEYPTPWRKRSTPFFATLSANRQAIQNRVQPCWVPASAYHFVESLFHYGFHKQARDFLLMLYQGMLERDATTWWEEWERNSSNCHAWGAFAAHHFTTP